MDNKNIKGERVAFPKNMAGKKTVDFDLHEVLKKAGEFDALENAFLIYYSGNGVKQCKKTALYWARKMRDFYPDDGIAKERCDTLAKELANNPA